MPATFQYFPYDTGAGSNVRGDRWREMFSWMRSNGIVTDDIVLNTTVSDLAVTPGTGLQVRVAEGDAFIQGTFFIQTGNFAELAISENSSGNPRIDLIVLSADFVANTTEYEVLTGTPAMSPVAPTPTQSDTLWQLPLYSLAVANGASSFITANLTDLRVRSVQDSSGVTLTSDGMGESLVTEAIGPDLAIKSLTAGSNITLTPGMDDITIAATGGGGAGDSVCVATHSTSQVIGSYGDVACLFNTALYDPSGMLNNSGSPNRIEILEDGVYQISCNITIQSEAGSDYAILQLFAYPSNTYLALGTQAANSAGFIYSLNLMRIINCTAGDAFYIRIVNISSNTNGIYGIDSIPTPFFSAVKIA